MKIKYISLCLCILAAAGSAYGQLTKRNLLKRYSEQQVAASLPLHGNWKPFPQTPAEWKAKLPDSVLKKFIRAGEIALGKEFKSIPATVALEFVRTGNRSHYSKLSAEKRGQLWDLIIAESVEGKGRFTDQILNGVWSVTEETFWGIPAHLSNQKAGKGLPDAEDPIIELYAAETASLLAWTDYFAGAALDTVSRLVRPRIRYEVSRRIFNPMLTANYFYLGRGNPDAKLNNWTPWIMSNFITANLLLEPDQAKKARAIVFAMKYIDQYMNGLGNDGGCDEGPGYWFGAGGAVFDALSMLDDASGGKINIYREPFIQKMAAYIYKTHIAGNYFINVADASPTMEPDGLILYRFGKATGDSRMMSFGSWAYHRAVAKGTYVEQPRKSRSLYNLAAMQECFNYPPAYTDVPEVWFSDVQLMASRSAGGLFVAAHGGHNGESHNHNDVGDFMIYANGQPVIVDVGSGAYTARTFSDQRYTLWFNTSAFHNLPTVNGYQQAAGTAYAASAVQYRQGKAFSELEMNIAGAYPPGSGLALWLRDVKLDKQQKGITITDKYRFKQPAASITQSFMTVCPTEIAAGKVTFRLDDGSKLFMAYDAAQWEFKKEKIVLKTEEDEKFRQNWPGKDIWRILLINKKKTPEGTAVYRFYK